MAEDFDAWQQNPYTKTLLESIARDYVPKGAKRRTEVEWFADAMERKLRANDHKRHWSNMSIQYLSMRLTQERKELYRAVAEGDPEKVLAEAADVANFAMMLADMVKRAAAPGGVKTPDGEQTNG